MDVSTITSAVSPSVSAVIISYLAGLGYKRWSKVNDKDIPFLCGLTGGVVGVIIYFVAPELLSATDPISAFVTGIISGFASTGINQLYKQNSSSGES